jgi:hypothetical protein
VLGIYSLATACAMRPGGAWFGTLDGGKHIVDLVSPYRNANSLLTHDLPSLWWVLTTSLPPVQSQPTILVPSMQHLLQRGVKEAARVGRAPRSRAA